MVEYNLLKLVVALQKGDFYRAVALLDVAGCVVYRTWLVQ